MRNNMTITIVFLAESANYGEGFGNISSLKKMSRGDYQQYSYISRQALRYSLISQLGWDNTGVDGKSGVVQFEPSATIKEYPEIDLFGYMKTTAKNEEGKGGASTRRAVARLSNAISLEPYQGDLDFLTNMGLAQNPNRRKEKKDEKNEKKLDNAIAQSEIHRAYYSYTVTIDLEKVGVDGDVVLPQEEKTNRVQTLLDGIQYLYRDIRGRRENLSPLFVIGGRYEIGLPFFENRIMVEKNAIKVETLEELIKDNEQVAKNTKVGVVTGIFANDNNIKEQLSATSVGTVFQQLKEEVKQYYEGN